MFVRKRGGNGGGKEKWRWRDDDILARGKLLRMIGDDHLLEEGALVLKQSLFSKCKFGPTCRRAEKMKRKGKQKRERVKIKKRKH